MTKQKGGFLTLATSAPDGTSLSFPISNQSVAQATLTITNPTSDVYALYKVKTNRPERYLVRPNQGLIEPLASSSGGGASSTAEISILIVPAHIQTLLTEASSAAGVKPVCKDKFLVQSTTLDEKRFRELNAYSPKDRVAALNAIWASVDQQAVHASKLVVAWRFTDEPGGGGGGAIGAVAQGTVDALGNLPVPSLSSAKEQLKRSLASTKPDPVSTRGGSTSKAASSGGGEGGAGSEAQGPYEQLMQQRKTYDELVAFTVNLTGERDGLRKELERIRTDMDQPNAAGGGKPPKASGGSSAAWPSDDAAASGASGDGGGGGANQLDAAKAGGFSYIEMLSIAVAFAAIGALTSSS